jgi:hypothetical protein
MEGVQAVPGVGTQLDEYIRYDSPLKDINDYRARMKELQKTQMDPNTSKDPQLKAELTRKKVMLDTEAREMGFVSEDSADNELEILKTRANQESKNGYVQHVNKSSQGGYYISDWYDSDETVASYENGRDLMAENQSRPGANAGAEKASPNTVPFPRCGQQSKSMEESGIEDESDLLPEDLNNGYDDVHYVTGGDYFPNGADGPVVKAVGPSGARQGDNPEQKKMQVAETHKELVYSYRNYLKESASQPKKIAESDGKRKFIVHVKYSDPSGSGSASVNLTIPAVRDGKHAKHVAEYEAERKGYKNARVIRATEIKPKA